MADVLKYERVTARHCMCICMTICDLVGTCAGVKFLAAGWDPEVHRPCAFDDCRTKRIIKFTYLKGCRTVLTPGGQFKVPDQISVLNKYETTARTDVYQNEKEKDMALAGHANMAYGSFSLAVKGGFSNKESSEEHTADRKIDVKLYTLYVENVDTKISEFQGNTVGTIKIEGGAIGSAITSATTTAGYVRARNRNSGLEPEFVMDASQLPTRFGQDSYACIRFLRKWGRYVLYSFRNYCFCDGL